MNRLFKLIFSGITLFLLSINIGQAAITAEPSPHGGFFFAQSASQAILTLSKQKGNWKQKGTLKLLNCETTIQPENSWHVETILLHNYVKMFFSYSGLDVPAVLSGFIKKDNKNILVVIPLELDKTTQDGSALIYNKVKTYTTNISQNLELSDAHLVVYPPRIHHGHSICFPTC